MANSRDRRSMSRRVFCGHAAALGVGALAAGTFGAREARAEESALGPAETPAQALARLRDGNARFIAGKPIAPNRDLAQLRALGTEADALCGGARVRRFAGAGRGVLRSGIRRSLRRPRRRQRRHRGRDREPRIRCGRARRRGDQSPRPLQLRRGEGGAGRRQGAGPDQYALPAHRAGPESQDDGPRRRHRCERPAIRCASCARPRRCSRRASRTGISWSTAAYSTLKPARCGR